MIFTLSISQHTARVINQKHNIVFDSGLANRLVYVFQVKRNFGKTILFFRLLGICLNGKANEG